MNEVYNDIANAQIEQADLASDALSREHDNLAYDIDFDLGVKQFMTETGRQQAKWDEENELDRQNSFDHHYEDDSWFSDDDLIDSPFYDMVDITNRLDGELSKLVNTDDQLALGALPWAKHRGGYIDNRDHNTERLTHDRGAVSLGELLRCRFDNR